MTAGHGCGMHLFGGLEIAVCAFISIEGKLFVGNEVLTICMGVNVFWRRMTKERNFLAFKIYHGEKGERLGRVTKKRL